jgi:phosphoglucomutase
VTKKGKTGAEEIQKMMVDYRQDPPALINNSQVILIRDYLTLREKNLLTGKEKVIDLPKSNVLQFILEDGSRISVRPSGTEPKIKYYFSVKENLDTKEEYNRKNVILAQKISDIIASMKLK